MSCRKHALGAEAHCVGWLIDQLGPDNIRPQITMLDCENVHELHTIGEQHKRFEDTPPEGSRSRLWS